MSNAILQLYYTSCQKGASGYAGFQTRALSDGIDALEQREIERQSLYMTPRSLPPQPDAATIAAEFPVALKMLTLQSGRRAVIRSCYVGQDYSGRWGNYFAHALVTPPDIEPLWPIDLAGWSGWRGGLDPGEGDTDPIPLPTIELSCVGAESPFSLDNLNRFLSQEDRYKLLPQMLRAVFRRTQDSRSLVIRTIDSDSAAYWIACIQKAFPLHYQRGLNSATYQPDGRSCLDVNVTYGEADFLFNETERKYQFYLFDLVDGLHSEVPEQDGEYADAIASWMAADPEMLDRFHRFAGLFGHCEIDDEIVHLLRFFQLSQGEPITLSRAGLHGLLAFTATHAQAHGCDAILDALDSVLARFTTKATSADWSAVVTLLARIASLTGREEHGARVFSVVETALSGQGEGDQDWSWAFDPYNTANEFETMVNHMVSVLIRMRRTEAIDKSQYRETTTNIGRALARALGRITPAERWRTLVRLAADGPNAMVVVGEWSARMESAEDMLVLHAQYEQSLLTQSPEFSQKWSAHIAHRLWNNLSEEHRNEQARRWITSGGISTFEAALTGAVLTAAAKSLSFVTRKPADVDMASRISAVSTEKGITLSPNRPAIRLALEQIYEGNLQALIGLREALKEVDAATYADAVEGGLPSALNLGLTPEHHGAVIEAFYQARYPTFGEVYVRWWRERRRLENYGDVDLASILFWLTLPRNQKFGRRLQPIDSLSIDAIAGRVGNLPSAKKADLYKQLMAHPSFNGNKRGRLDDFIERANAMKTPWWKSLFGGT